MDIRVAAHGVILEETGHTAILHEVLGVDSIVIPAADRLTGSGPLQGLRIVYRAEITGGSLRNEIEGSTDEAAWFSLNDVREIQRGELVDFGISMFEDRRT